jgi:hypothetical protein
MARQGRRDAVSTPVRHGGKDQDITFSNRANAAMAGTAAILAERLNRRHRFLDEAAADLVAAVADADREDAGRLGLIGQMVGAGDLVRRTDFSCTSASSAGDHPNSADGTPSHYDLRKSVVGRDVASEGKRNGNRNG